MTSVSVSVEANGWILAVRGSWAATTGSWRLPGNVVISADHDRTNAFWANGGVDQFPLTPSDVPKIVLSVQDAGFDRVGGLPVANANRPRTVVATKPLRRPWPNQSQLDETDHGDGTRTVRFALSDRIYSTSTVVSASFLSGWKAGQPGGVVNTVANNSTRAAPPPIFRWANEPWPLVQGTTATPNHIARVELIVATHHPEHFGSALHQACAAVRLRAFDGTTTKDFFFTAPQTSPLYGDNLRCWGGDIDLSGLSAGPITVHATVFPWIGAERATGTAHSTSITAALASEWGGPFHLYYDPDGTVWPRRYVAVHPDGALTDAGVVLHTSAAAAEAAPAATKAANYTVALDGFANASATMPARNGFAAVGPRCCAWWEVLLPAGTWGHVANRGASGLLSAGPGYLVVSHEPGALNPRSDVIFGYSGTRLTNFAIDRVKVRGIRLHLGSSEFFVIRTGSWVSYENCDIRSVAGSQGSTATLYQSEAHSSIMQCDMRDRAAMPRGWFARNVTRTSAHNTAAAAALIGVRIVSPQAGEFAPSRTVGAFTPGTDSIDDLMLWNCEVYNWGGVMFTSRAQQFFGQDRALFRLAMVNTLVESTGGPLQQVGETVPSQLRDSIFEAVTLVGGRFNLHNDTERAASAGSAAFRVNNSPNTEIEVGILAHGLVTGDTITTSGSNNANLNRVNVPVTVLDANRFRYVAAAAVTAVPSTLPTIVVTGGVRAGQTLEVVRANLRQTGNVIRYSSFERNATKHDTFSAASNLTGSWELVYGVGYRGNVNANRGTATPTDFQYAFYGIGSEAATGFGDGTQTGVESFGVNWQGFVSDNSVAGPQNPAATFNGDYRADTITAAPFKPSRLLGRGSAPAVIDRDAQNAVRGLSFAGGGRGDVVQSPVAVGLHPALAASSHTALSSRISWSGFVRPAGSVIPHLADRGGLRPTAEPVPPGVRRRVLRVTRESRRQGVEPD